MSTDPKESLRKEYERLVDLLEMVDPIQAPDLYGSLLENIDGLYHLSGLAVDDKEALLQNCSVIGFDNPQPEPEPSEEEFYPPVMTTPAEPYVEPTPFPNPEETVPVGKTYTKEEVRAALAKSRKNGTNVTELLAEFGATNFTGLPAAKYGELMARLGED